MDLISDDSDLISDNLDLISDDPDLTSDDLDLISDGSDLISDDSGMISVDIQKAYYYFRSPTAKSRNPTFNSILIIKQLTEATSYYYAINNNEKFILLDGR